MNEYKGYDAQIAFDDEAGLFHGEVLGTRDVITFQGRSVDELRRAFHDSVDDYLDWCAERGKSPDKPYSGRLLLRLDPALHRAADLAARRDGKSLNAWIVERLAAADEGAIARAQAEVRRWVPAGRNLTGELSRERQAEAERE